MFRELDKTKWLKALINAQNKGLPLGAVTAIQRIIQVGLQASSKNDLAALDAFYPHLEDEEQDNLKQFIISTHDYVEANPSGIKTARKKVGLTQKEFSDQFEIPLDVVKSWDSGRRKPPAWAEKLLIEKLEKKDL